MCYGKEFREKCVLEIEIHNILKRSSFLCLNFFSTIFVGVSKSYT